MNEIQIRNLDLNLLLVFRVLMEEGSVNRAAEQLGRTPSAVSHALGRLREQLGDPLLVRTGGIMKPSPRAEALYDEVRPILSHIERVVQPPAAFDPTTSNRTFKLAGPALDIISSKIIALIMPKHLIRGWRGSHTRRKLWSRSSVGMWILRSGPRTSLCRRD